MNEILKMALIYSNRASIIPVGQDKKPLINWKEYQTKKATKEEIQKWWEKYPNANVGIITGKISNLAVVDVEKGGDITDLPKTATVRTGGGGWHLYYRYCEGIENKARIRPLTDIRGEGGYVVAAPSIHQSGQKYEWITKGEVQSFPKHLFGIKQETKWDDVALGITEGQRNETATQYIGKLMTIYSPDTWENTVWLTAKIWNERNNPPLGENELRQVYESIKRRAIKNEKGKIEILNDELKIVHISKTEQLFAGGEKYNTQYPLIDEAIGGGVEDGDLIIISAPTGAGKTTLMQSLTYNLVKQGLPCLWFSYEVLLHHLWTKFQNMGLTEDNVIFAPFRVASGNMNYIHTAIKRAKEKFYTKFVFIDHLGFLVPKLSGNNMSRNYSAYLQQICRELKTIAISEQIIIVLASHMRKTDNPSINDIRDSAGIAQEADLVFLLNRKITDDQDYFARDTQCILAKNRKTGKGLKTNLTMFGDKFKETSYREIRKEF